MIYFIRAGRLYVKIGYCLAFPHGRMAQLQTGNPLELELIGLVEGSRKDEAEWHRRFRHLRVRGEWFRWTGELRKAAKPYLKSTAIKQFERSQDEVAAIRAKLGLPASPRIELGI